MKDTNIKWVVISNAIQRSVGCLTVLFATYITNNANCLWALILVACMGSNYSSKNDDENIK